MLHDTYRGKPRLIFHRNDPIIIEVTEFLINNTSRLWAESRGYVGEDPRSYHCFVFDSDDDMMLAQIRFSAQSKPVQPERGYSVVDRGRVAIILNERQFAEVSYNELATVFAGRPQIKQVRNASERVAWYASGKNHAGWYLCWSDDVLKASRTKRPIIEFARRWAMQ